MTRSADVLLAALDDWFDDAGQRIIACSGGVDSLTLATAAHAHDPEATVVAHTISPAVPAEGTARVVDTARRHDWNLELMRSGEFDDERYLANPTDRCYYCKTNLYDAIGELIPDTTGRAAVVLSGANLDDLGEYRPGLTAAAEHGVRHPFVELDITKAEIRVLARHLGSDAAELPASPCLASRLYTGTRVTASRLQAIEAGEAILRQVGAPVARCRIRDAAVIVEVPADDRTLVTDTVLDDVAAAMRCIEPSIDEVLLDERPYRPGQAIVGAS